MENGHAKSFSLTIFISNTLYMIQVGSVAVFVLRHKDIVGGGKEDLLHIAHVIALNMVSVFIPCVSRI